MFDQNWEDFLSHLQKNASSTFYNCYNHFQNHKDSILIQDVVSGLMHKLESGANEKFINSELQSLSQLLDLEKKLSNSFDDSLRPELENVWKNLNSRAKAYCPQLKEILENETELNSNVGEKLGPELSNARYLLGGTAVATGVVVWGGLIFLEAKKIQEIRRAIEQSNKLCEENKPKIKEVGEKVDDLINKALDLASKLDKYLMRPNRDLREKLVDDCLDMNDLCRKVQWDIESMKVKVEGSLQTLSRLRQGQISSAASNGMRMVQVASQVSSFAKIHPIVGGVAVGGAAVFGVMGLMNVQNSFNANEALKELEQQFAELDGYKMEIDRVMEIVRKAQEKIRQTDVNYVLKKAHKNCSKNSKQRFYKKV